MSELNCATPDTPILSILSKIENIFGSLNQIVFENFTGSIDLFEADTFKDFTLEEIIPFYIDDRDAFWKIFTESAQYGFEDELYEILIEFEACEEVLGQQVHGAAWRHDLDRALERPSRSRPPLQSA